MRLEYLFFRLLCFFVGIVPIRLLYPLSSFSSYILQYIIRYRKTTVLKNLRNSFPEKSEKEIRRIAHSYYCNLCDVSLESIKGFTMPLNQLNKRYICLNPEVANEYFDKGQSIIFAMSHYANWEWGTQVARFNFWHDTVSFYKPLTNKYIDSYIIKRREAKGMVMCSIYNSKFIFRSEDRIPRAYFLVSDQSPSNKNNAYWVNFLNQDTACIRGLESCGRLFKLPIIYANVQRVKRGYYTVTLNVLCNNPRDTKQGEITNQYMNKLEEIIRQKPADWLWSHKRWKHVKLVDNFADFRASCIGTI